MQVRQGRDNSETETSHQNFLTPQGTSAFNRHAREGSPFRVGCATQSNTRRARVSAACPCPQCLPTLPTTPPRSHIPTSCRWAGASRRGSARSTALLGGKPCKCSGSRRRDERARARDDVERCRAYKDICEPGKKKVAKTWPKRSCCSLPFIYSEMCRKLYRLAVQRAAQGRPHSAANEDCRIFFASRGG